MSVEYFRTLYAYDRWANRVVLERASEASEVDYFAAMPGLSFGSLHATLVHIYNGEAVWLARWRGEPLTGLLANARRGVEIAETIITDLAMLKAAWPAVEEGIEEMLAGASDADLQRRITYTMSDGREFTQPLIEQLGHIANHGSQYRGEAALRLTQLGLSPGDLDLMTFLRVRG